MSTAPAASAAGTATEPRPGGGSLAAGPADGGGFGALKSVDSLPSAAAGAGDGGGGTAGTSPGSTSRPTPDASRGMANPQSSNWVAWSSSFTGRRSACIRLTASRRPSRSAAATKVCRAASVNPVLPPSVPG
jgi:hypothetical protein